MCKTRIYHTVSRESKIHIIIIINKYDTIVIELVWSFGQKVSGRIPTTILDAAVGIILSTFKIVTIEGII